MADVSQKLNGARVSSTGRVKMVWETLSFKGTWSEHSFNLDEDPRPELKDALRAMVHDVVDICELPADYCTRIEVSGCKFSYDDRDVMGVVYVASMRLDDSYQPLNIVTPHKNEYPIDKAVEYLDHKQHLTKDQTCAVYKFMEECWRYINGERAQTQLEFTTAENEAEEPVLKLEGVTL